MREAALLTVLTPEGNEKRLSSKSAIYCNTEEDDYANNQVAAAVVAAATAVNSSPASFQITV